VNSEFAKEGEELEIENEGKRTRLNAKMQKDRYDPSSKKVKA
jgi:hypothetical protein